MKPDADLLTAELTDALIRFALARPDLDWTEVKLAIENFAIDAPVDFYTARAQALEAAQ
jgi:hypothetical protein